MALRRGTTGLRAPPPGPGASRRTGAGPPGRCPSRQPLPRHRAAGPPGGRPAPPPGQRLGFPVGGRKRIPHPKGNRGKHIGKIVSLPPRTPPRLASEFAWHRPGGGGGSGLGKRPTCHRSRHPPQGRTGPHLGARTNPCGPPPRQHFRPWELTDLDRQTSLGIVCHPGVIRMHPRRFSNRSK